MSVLRQAAWEASRLISQKAGPVSRSIYQIANLYRKAYNNLNYDMSTNGEFSLLRKLAKFDFETIMDVGANKGDYTLACLNNFVDARIHSFEIAPATFLKLTSNISSDRAKLNNFGLSNKDGSFILNFNRDDDGSSSLVEGSNIHGGNWERIEAPVIRGDDYCQSEGIKSIDLLKIDVEGAEHMVLDGFSRNFEDGLVSTVQFEFGMVNIYSKYLLKDFYEFFGKYGFTLGPVMPQGVDFKEYNTRDEDFQGPPNFFAVHTSKTSIIDAVRK